MSLMKLQVVFCCLAVVCLLPLASAQGAGGTFVTKKVQLTSPTTRAVSKVIFTFKLSSNLETSQSVVLTLPGAIHSTAVTGSDAPSDLGDTTFTSADSNWEITWTSGASTLSYKNLGAEIAGGGADIVVSFPASFDGLVLPSSGYVANDARIKVAVPAGTVTVAEEAIGQSTATVGRFDDTKLTFTPRSAGVATEIGVFFRLTSDLAAADTVRLQLGGFSGPNVAALVFADGSNPGWSGSWDDTTKYVTLTRTGATVTGGTIQLLKIKVDNGIKLPAAGLNANSANVKIQSTAVAGPVASFVNIISSESVGVFSDTALTFTPAVAGTATTLKLAFKLAGKISTSETVSATLPGFTGNTFFSQVIPSGSLGASEWTVSWSSAGTKLTLTRSSIETSANTLITVELPAAWGITLPAAGIHKDTPLCTLETNAAAATVNVPRPFNSVQGVGMFSATNLTLSTAVTGQATALTFKFTLSANLTTADTITFDVKGFTRSAGAGAVALSGPNAAQFTGAFSPAAGGTSAQIVLTRTAAGNGGVAREVTVDASNDIRVPTAGLTGTAATDGLRVLTNAVDGPVSPSVALVASPTTTGTVTNVELDYDPRIAGAVAAITLKFQLSTDLVVGDHVNVTLPGFVGASRANVVVDAAADWTVSWSAEGSLLRLVRAGTPLTGLTSVTVVVDASNGIQLPAAGLTANAAALTISSNARNGPVSTRAITTSPAVGVLTATSLTFEPATAGLASKIGIKFTYSLPMAIGDKVAVLIPGLSITTFEEGTSVYPLTANAQFSAALTEQSITLVALAAVTANTPVTFTVPLADGVLLPSAGLAANDTRVRIEALAVAGSTNPAAIGISPQTVGSVTGTSLTYAPTDPDQPSVIGATWTLSADLANNEHVILSLPTFSGVDYASTISGWDFSWVRTPGILTLTRKGGLVTGGTAVTVSIPIVDASNSMRLPPGGMTENSATLKISTNAVAGVLAPTAIAVSPFVKALTPPVLMVPDVQASVVGVPVAFVVRTLSSDFSTGLTFASSDPTVVPLANIVASAGSSSRRLLAESGESLTTTVTITPIAPGTSTITVTNGPRAVESFVFTSFSQDC